MKLKIPISLALAVCVVTFSGCFATKGDVAKIRAWALDLTEYLKCRVPETQLAGCQNADPNAPPPEVPVW